MLESHIDFQIFQHSLKAVYLTPLLHLRATCTLELMGEWYLVEAARLIVQLMLIVNLVTAVKRSGWQ